MAHPILLMRSASVDECILYNCELFIAISDYQRVYMNNHEHEYINHPIKGSNDLRNQYNPSQTINSFTVVHVYLKYHLASDYV